MIVDRLVYGCARLTGGASAASSRRLVETCLAAGIRHFDSAPSYGMGTAEAVLGSVLAGRPDVRITAKVGSARPRWGVPMTYARALKAAIKPRVSPLRDSFTPPTPPPLRPAGSAMSVAAMARSLDISRQALRRERLDLVLLHDIWGPDLDEARVAFLDQVKALGVATAVGWSTGAVVDVRPMSHVPREWKTQAAASPATLRHGGSAPAPDYLHTIANTALLCQRTDAVFGAWLTAASALVPEGVADRRTATIAVAYMRVHALLPDRMLIFASIDAGRLSAFLAAIVHLDRQIGADAFRAIDTDLI